MDQITKKVNRSIKLFPAFSSFSADIIFFVPIDTLFLTLTKGLNASQITAITMVSLIICIITQKSILTATKKLGNTNSVKLGAFLLLISVIILTFGKSFIVLLLYKCIYEIAFMFLNMSRILLRNNLVSINREEDYYKIRNKSKIMYAIITMITALCSGYLFNLNNYLPMYLSIVIYFIILIASFSFYEAKEIKDNKINKKEIKNGKQKMASALFWVILSNAMFYSIIKMGQNNSKLFMQYDFQKTLSVEMVTYYITIIVFISRIARLIGNIAFGKLFSKLKGKTSIILTMTLALAFLLLIIGHFLQVDFISKVIIMSLGFFLILATRDSFQVYAEDVALHICDKDEQQKAMIDVEISRKIVTLLLSAIFTLVLLKYDLIVVEFILLILAIIEIFINIKMYRKLKEKIIYGV